MDLRRSVYRQQGGTTAGLIIGLIIAVGSILLINKNVFIFCILRLINRLN